jgi:sec-independent protein translocase protein TatC
VATETPPRSPKRRDNPEGRMPLREHLLELRKRVVIAAIAVILCSVAGWYLYNPVFDYITEPIAAAEAAGEKVSINFGQVGSAFDLQLKMSVWIGIILASPVWIYELWAFITPGLTKKEKRYALGFVAVAVPLFLAGVYLSSFFIPNVFTFFTSFTPDSGSNIISADVYLGFVMRTVLAFGIAFLLPVVLVALNLAGLLAGKSVLKAWRWVTVLCFAFAAVATPTPDITSMFLLALPMLLLFAIAIAVCMVNDKRRGKGDPQYAGLSDDEASAL